MSARKKKPEAPKEAPSEGIVAFKGLDAKFQCRGFQYEVGKTYAHDGNVKRCESGFHSCEYPLDVFDYYPPAQSRFALVKASGAIDREANGDTKIASASIEIVAELRIPDLVSRAVEWIIARVENTKVERNTGNWSAATNTGDQSAATNTGYQSAAEVSGKHALAIACGAQSKARASATGAIVLVNRADDGTIRHIRAAKVGDGIKDDIWYSLDKHGEFVEVEAEGAGVA